MFAKIAAKRRGFTLIELLVVIVIIAVLAMIAIPKFQDAGQRSKEASLRSDLTLIRGAVANYFTDTGTYPTALADLAATTAPAQGLDKTGTAVNITATDWHGPYLQSLPKDPLTNPEVDFSYTTSGTAIGSVASTASGNGLDGKAYSNY